MIKQTQAGCVCPGHVRDHDLLSADEPPLFWVATAQQTPRGPWKCTTLPLLEGRVSDFSVAIFQPNVSKQLKGLGEQALLTTSSVLNPAVGPGLKCFF